MPSSIVSGLEGIFEEGDDQSWKHGFEYYYPELFDNTPDSISSGNFDIETVFPTLDESPFPQHSFNAPTYTMSEVESPQPELGYSYKNHLRLEDSPHLDPLREDITRTDDRDEDFMSTRSRFSKTTFYTASSGISSRHRPIDAKHLQK